MNKIWLILFLGIVLISCELVRIGVKKSPAIEPTQKTPLGAVYLFIAELENNNALAASKTILTKDKLPLGVKERVELADELVNLSREIKNREITFVKKDSLQINKYRFTLEFDYLKQIDFTTEKINEKWYILEYKELN